MEEFYHMERKEGMPKLNIGEVLSRGLVTAFRWYPDAIERLEELFYEREYRANEPKGKLRFTLQEVGSRMNRAADTIIGNTCWFLLMGGYVLISPIPKLSYRISELIEDRKLQGEIERLGKRCQEKDGREAQS